MTLAAPPAFDPASAAGARHLLAGLDAVPNRLLGQNFLVNGPVLDRIVQAGEVLPNDRVLEIGPGLGALTVRLLGAGAQVTAIERDTRFVRLLAEHLGGQPLRLVAGDALETPWDSLELPDLGVKVVANLPYSISKPMLRRLMEEWRPHLSTLTVLVQREVALRLVARPGTPEYGPLGVMAHLWGEPRRCFDIQPGSFLPAPEVVSTLVHIPLRRLPAVPIGDEAWFWKVVRAAFGQRRKQLVNTLALVAPRAQVDAALAACAVDPRRRGETLSLAEFAALSAALAPVPATAPEQRPA